MLNNFHYKNFEPELDQRICAEGVVGRLEDAAPFSSTVLGIIEKQSSDFFVKVDVYSRLGVLSVSAQDENFEKALLNVEEKMKAKLDQWRRDRWSRFANLAKVIPLKTSVASANA